MNKISKFYQALLGAAVVMAISISASAFATELNEQDVICKKVKNHKACSFIDGFGRECTVVYGARGLGLQCRDKKSPHNIELL